MQKTNNYNLNQWEASDPICRADFNSDNAAIDGALAKVNTDLAAVLAAVGSGGENCRMAFGTYTGTGTYGATGPNQLAFEFCPVLVYVGSQDEAFCSGWPAVFLRSCPVGHHESQMSTLTVTWRDNGMDWYSNSDYYQMNQQGTTYYYAALGYDMG